MSNRNDALSLSECRRRCLLLFNQRICYARFPKSWLTKRNGKLMIYVINVDGHAFLLICVIFISLYMNQSYLLQIVRVRKDNVLLNILIQKRLSKLVVEVKVLNIWNVESIWININVPVVLIDHADKTT